MQATPPQLQGTESPRPGIIPRHPVLCGEWQANEATDTGWTSFTVSSACHPESPPNEMTDTPDMLGYITSPIYHQPDISPAHITTM
jgi:hypothetical protein